MFQSTANCVIKAGPGSGKTKTITVKVAKLLRDEVPHPRGVACITYNNECVGEIQARLSALDVEATSRLYVGSVHAFSLNHIVRPYGHIVGILLPATVAQKKQCDSLKKMAMGHAGLRPSIKQFDRFRRSHFSRDPEWCSHAPLWGKAVETYESALADQDLTDFDQMIQTGVALVRKHSWIRDVIKAKFPVLVVDEYQDLGTGLHELVKRLLEHGVRVIAVGDPDQSIYGFNGAAPHLLTELYSRSDVEPIELTTNYRCGSLIIHASNRALGETRAIKAHSTETGIVLGHTVPTLGHPSPFATQIQYLLNTVLPDLTEAGIGLGDIGILYPKNDLGTQIAQGLTAHGLDFRGGSPDARYRSSALTTWVEEMALWCCGGWQTGEPPLSKLLLKWERLNAVGRGTSEARHIRIPLVKYLWGHREPSMPLSKWLEGLVQLGVSGILEGSPDRADEADTWKGLLEAAAQPDKLQHWTLQRFSDAKWKRLHPHLVTLHSSKGLEYDAVVIMGITEPWKPAWLSAQEFAEEYMEERRKYYVAISRARKQAHILWYDVRPPILDTIFAPR